MDLIMKFFSKNNQVTACKNRQNEQGIMISLLCFRMPLFFLLPQTIRQFETFLSSFRSCSISNYHQTHEKIVVVFLFLYLGHLVTTIRNIKNIVFFFLIPGLLSTHHQTHENAFISSHTRVN